MGTRSLQEKLQDVADRAEEGVEERSQYEELNRGGHDGGQGQRSPEDAPNPVLGRPDG
jgi:hypothetical protein